MKKIITINLLLFFSIKVFSQISGEFNGNPTYFKGTNERSYSIYIKVYAINDELHQSLKWTYIIKPDQYFTIDSNDGWNWEYGEKLVVVYSDGSKDIWINKIIRKPSFTGAAGKHCSGERHSCICPGYVAASRANWDCRNCPHSRIFHK